MCCNSNDKKVKILHRNGVSVLLSTATFCCVGGGAAGWAIYGPPKILVGWVIKDLAPPIIGPMFVN